MLRPLYCLTVLLHCVLVAVAQPTPQQRIDSLEAVLRTQPRADSSRVKTLLALVFEYKSRDLERATALEQEALATSQRIGYGPGTAKAWRFKAMLGFFSGNLTAAQQAAEQSRRAYRQLGDSVGLAEAFSTSGALYLAQGRLESAGQIYLRALRLQEQYGTPKGVAQTLANLGQVMLGMHRYEQAITYYDQYARTNGSLRNPADALTIYLSLGAAHWRLRHDTTATRLLTRALALSQQIGDVRGEGTAHMELGQFQLERRQYEASRAHMAQAVRTFEPARMLPQAGKAHTGLADALIQLKRYPEAIPELRRALAIATEIGDAEGRTTAYESLSRAYTGANNLREALNYQRLAMQWQDTVLTAAGVERVAELQTKYETGQKDARNRVLAAELATQQQISRRRNVLLWSSLAIAALLAGAGYLLLTRRRLRREVEFAQERQQLTQQRAQAVLEAEETERRRIGADLHDSIGQLLTAARLNLGALGEQLPLATEGQRALLGTAQQVVDESFREVRSISHNLMPNALVKRGLSQAVRDFLNQLAPDGHLRVEVQVVGLDQGPRLPPTVESVLFRVIQELVQNIVKHAQATEITLQLIRGDADLTVMVEDNGVGFDPAVLEPGAGIGLRNVETRMAYLGGRADFDTAPGRGTIVTLEVPLTPSAQ